MSDNLAIIRRVIEEHHNIRGNIKLVEDSINDMEAIFGLQKMYSDWTQSSIDAMAEKQGKLQQTLGFLDEGLKNHFSLEEQALPPLFGELLMRALLLEHREISREIGEVKSMVADIRLEESGREELLAKKPRIQQGISVLSQMIETHAAKEEVILRMLERVLEK